MLASYATNFSAADDCEAGIIFLTEATIADVAIINHFTTTITAITASTIKAHSAPVFCHNGDAKGQRK